MEIKNASTTSSKSNELRNINSVWWESRNITTNVSQINFLCYLFTFPYLPIDIECVKYSTFYMFIFLCKQSVCNASIKSDQSCCNERQYLWLCMRRCRPHYLKWYYISLSEPYKNFWFNPELTHSQQVVLQLGNMHVQWFHEMRLNIGLCKKFEYIPFLNEFWKGFLLKTFLKSIITGTRKYLLYD